MAGSAADAITQAVERAKQVLFPLKGEKWFALGFTVFLAQCGEGGGSGSLQLPNFPGFGGSGAPGHSSSGSSAGADFQKMLDEALRALHSELALYLALAVGGVLLLLAFWTFVLWFSSRAKLMLVESVVWDRVDVNAQWSRAADLGLSLFKFRTILGLSGLTLIGAVMAGAVVAAFPDLQSGHWLGSRAVIGYSLLGFAVLCLGLPLAIVSLLLDDFVVPLMVVRNVRVGEAWRMCRAEVLSGNVAGVVLFYFLRFVLAIGISIAAAVVTCMTCCLTAIPYLGTVILLPIFVFWRAYSLCYLEQLGLRIFPEPEPAWAIYDQWRFPR